MPDRTGQLLGRVRLTFGGEDGALVPDDLSAIARQSDGTLWVAADERAALERLRPVGPYSHSFHDHRHLSLARALGLAEDAEIDIEGIDVEDDGALWLIGSHSAKRKKPRDEGTKDDLARLATVECELSRAVLARIPFEEGALRIDERAHLAAYDDETSSLTEILADDEHLGRFVPHRDQPAPIPGKDNGFDVEGLAVRGERLLIGLRGPVLRGWAFVLELALEVERDRLAPRSIGKRAYRKHALGLDGLGVRELMICGDDVLIVAGPTMTLDGAHRVFRWRPEKGRGDTLTRQAKGELEPLFDLPMTVGRDHAEGACTFDWFEHGDSMIVVYDAPSRTRRLGDDSVLADVFALPTSK